MKQAEKFVAQSFVSRYAGSILRSGGRRERSGEAIARNLFEMSGLKVPVLDCNWRRGKWWSTCRGSGR